MINVSPCSVGKIKESSGNDNERNFLLSFQGGGGRNLNVSR
jgi:hypothetical protein